MNPCAHTDQLDAYLDGDLAPEAARAFEAHAAGCPACAEERALAERVLAGLRALPAAPCPDDVFEAALARIAREATARPALPAARARMPRWRAVGVGVTFLALLAAALLLLRPAADSNPAPSVVTTETPPAPSPDTVLPADAVAPEAPVVAAEPPARPPVAPRRRAPRPAADPAAPIAEPVAEATPPAAAEATFDPHSPEAEAARDGALLALSLVAEANQHAGAAVRENVGQQLDRVTDALALAFPE